MRREKGVKTAMKDEVLIFLMIEETRVIFDSCLELDSRNKVDHE